MRGARHERGTATDPSLADADGGRSFEIIVDGDRVGHIPVLGSTEIPIEAGQHTMQLHVRKILNIVDRHPGRGSASLTFHVAEGETVEFSCHPPSFPKALWSFIAAMSGEPSRWILLEGAHSRSQSFAVGAR